jgi:2-dehydro-3-deoxygalactonokinase
MYFITLDCGTTNSRAYVVDEFGKVFGKAAKTVGVRDTATTGSKKTLQEGVKEIIKLAVQNAGLNSADIQAVLSSGMITSEIGLVEIPHMVAPVGLEELAKGLLKVESNEFVEDNLPVYFVRGIKNNVDVELKSASSVVGRLDFMRGEEAQVMGILERQDVSLPAIVLILSSHTKFIPVDAQSKITGSLTTMSGQLYDAIMNHTFVGKSVCQIKESEIRPENYFDSKIVDDAIQWIRDVGLVRSLMFPRFLDVLLKTTWYERQLFFEALIAAEDILAMDQLSMLNITDPTKFILVGNPERCLLYRHILVNQFPNAKYIVLSKEEEIDSLSIHGNLKIAKVAGVY